MSLLDEQHLLLTVGDQEFDGWHSETPLPQEETASYGKIIVIETDSKIARIYSRGHRNPQGLYVDAHGSIWSTEHGPEGGDELNLILQGTNYGWPLVTLGTEYGSFSWPLSQRQGEHDEFELPIFAWTPAIGISSLLGVEQDLFPIWHGDLLVSSLKDRALWRVRVRQERVLYVERIDIGEKIRDLVEGGDGRFILWTDRGHILTLQPALENLFASCAGCHPISKGGNHGIGPNLRGIVGKPVASSPSFDYSGALRDLGGKWTADRLNQFLLDPESFAPGTLMLMEGITDPTARAMLIDYLKKEE